MSGFGEALSGHACVAIAGRGVLIAGPPGSGKSSLALALIDRGALLVGDDALRVSAREGRLTAAPHETTRGLLEVRNLGLIPLSVCETVPVCLVCRLDPEALRFIETADATRIAGCDLPLVRLSPHDPVLAIKAELALRRYGLPP